MMSTRVCRSASILLSALPALALPLLVMLSGCSSAPETRARPNILILFADDQRTDTIGAWGNPSIKTPNIDGLVNRGFSFRRNYCLGGNSGAVCVPSRAMLNSGKSYFKISNDLEGVKILPELLRENGYVTFGTGKWHNQQPSFQRGFLLGKSIFFGGMSDHTKVPIHDLGANGGLTERGEGPKFSSELFADAAIEFLENYNGDKPFYAYVAFTAPHDPRQPPLEYRQPYYDWPPPLPKNFMPRHPFDNGEMTVRDEQLGAWPRTADLVRDQLAEYYGMVAQMDAQFGRILETLEKTGRVDNTYVIYAADHGLAVGSHGLLGKQNLYEHSMGAPLVVAGRGIPAGGSTQAFTYLLDIFPTVCALTGAAPPADLDGFDLGPLWRGETDSVRDRIFLAYRGLMRSIRDHRWKLIRYPPIDHTQLFDLENDPDELNNLADDPAQAGRIEEMMVFLAEGQKTAGDDLPLSVADPRPMEIDLSGFERTPDRWQPEWIIEKYFPAVE